jgi:general stress protein 26
MRKLAPLAFAPLAFLASSGPAGDPPKQALDRAAMIAAAREIIAAQTYCALVTIDETGRPSIRTMNPFPPEEDMSVWMATSTRSRKVQHIQRDPRVALYYADHTHAIGEVVLIGRAELTEDRAEILKRKRAYWDQAFPGLENLTLIRVVPERLEVVNYKAGLNNDSVTFRAPSVELGPARE